MREKRREAYKNMTAEERGRIGRRIWKQMDPKVKAARIAKLHAEANAAGKHAQGAITRLANMSAEERRKHMAMMRRARAKKRNEWSYDESAVLAQLAKNRVDMTPEKLSEMGKKGAATLNARMTTAERRKNAKKGAAMRHFIKKGYIVEAK